MLAGHLDRLDEISINVSDREHHNNNNNHDDSNSESQTKSEKSSINGGIDNSSMSDSNATGGSRTTSAKAETEILADKVSQHVFWLKMTVLLVLLGATILVSVALYWSTQKAEVSAFDAATDHHVRKIIDSVQFHLERTLGAIDSFSVAITSLAAHDTTTNVTWPLITVPDFEFRAANAREMARASAIALLPLVTSSTRAAWEDYAVQNTKWIDNAELFQASLFYDKSSTTTTTTTGSSRTLVQQDEEEEQEEEDEELEAIVTRQQQQRALQMIPPSINGVSSSIFHLDASGVKQAQAANKNQVYFPMWEHSPLDHNLVNYDLRTDPNFQKGIQSMLTSPHAILGEVWNIDDTSTSSDFLKKWEFLEETADADFVQVGTDPVSMILYPVYNTLQEDEDDDDTTTKNQHRAMVAILVTIVHWDQTFESILPPHANGLICVVSNDCGQVFTYVINGETSHFLGHGDLHDRHYDSLGQSMSFADMIQHNSDSDDNDDNRVKRFADVGFNVDYCPYHLHVYPSKELEEYFTTNNPLVYTASVVIIFVFTAIVFLVYDWIVERRQRLVMKRAVQSRAIVSSLFPAAVRDRLFRNDDSSNNNNHHKKGHAGGGMGGEYFDDMNNKRKNHRDTAKMRLKNMISGPSDIVPPEERRPMHEMRPIADLFPHTTVMFADIAGFTRWSSDRDPAHVFTLLQTVYHAFDRIAKKRVVFKVETIGDCYVAVTGLPDPQEDHAVRMAKFANECMRKMSELVVKLKETLGEDTAELCMRFGLHSGPVTAGVLRGEKSRFQLFGNTVNTAARMENSGQRMKIQCSQETADLITDAGKGHWIYQRIDDIASRGGIQTFWVEPRPKEQEAKMKNAAPTRVMATTAGPATNSNQLVNWNVDMFKRLLKRIVAHRRDVQLAKGTTPGVNDDLDNTTIGSGLSSSDKAAQGRTVRDETADQIIMPVFDNASIKTNPDTIDLSEKVEAQLRDYVSTIADLYHDNPFHSFKHASNVCTNCNKMLSSIVDPEMSQRTSNPLTQFAVVFSALIHDTDHMGVTNMQLIKEKPHIAQLYRNKSVAEQNSVDLAWNLLMDPKYAALQDTIFSNHQEFKLFRNIVVNVVMATDIFDKDMNANRTSRWINAFDQESRTEEMDAESVANLKATLIVEHSMQVADVMHTMQHFHSYQRWSERLFEEMYAAFDAGRTRKDPSEDWYQGEIWFFDNCVIPLSQRIKDCGVFGVQGDDCLRNAISNKKEWTVKGNGIVKEMLSKYNEAKFAAEAKKEDEKESSTEVKDKGQIAEDKAAAEKAAKESRDKHMVEWNVDLCKRLLRQILANRMATGRDSQTNLQSISKSRKEGTTTRDEVQRIIQFPAFDKKASKLLVDPDTITISKAVEEQLRDYIGFIASMYREIAFHNFKHASNVSMTCNKYLQRIADDTLQQQMDHPLAQFSIIFASLVHDVDHSGVSNAQLIEEKQRVALLYQNKSVAEQNSADLAWTVLMDAGYKDLQDAIFSNQEEFDLFRGTIINGVIATDLFDEELIADRNKRWAEAFDPVQRDPTLSDDEQQNLRATIVMEHVMQTSDIGHTMQHFHSYRRWNERLFQETYGAFEDGRLEDDPSRQWYENEIKFFDQYAIPLAKKLKECGMFGIAGDDALSCAQSNRKEWVIQGVKIVDDFIKKYHELKKQNAIMD